MSAPEPASQSGKRRPAPHRRLSAACLAAAVAVLLVAVIAGYVQRALLNPDQFANRATAALQDERLRARIGVEITDRLVLANAADLQTARPLIERAVAEVVGGAAFRQLFRAAVADVHRATFERDRDTVTLTIADAGTVVAAALEQLRPAVADRIREDARVTLLRRDVDAHAADLARTVEHVHELALILAALTLALAFAGLLLAPDRRRAVTGLGAGAAAAGLLIVVGYAVARSIALDQVRAVDRDAAGAIWDAFLEDLRTAGWILAGSGAVIAAASASVLRPVAVAPALRRLGRLVVDEPARPAWRALRALLLIAAGVLVIARPAAVLSLLATVAGIGLVYVGATELLRMIDRPRDATAPEPERPLIGRRLVAAGVAMVLIAGAWAVFLAGGGATQAAPAVTGCNGHRALCDRPLDSVVLAATHNSMGAGPGWYAAQQDAPIADQLADGIRGLLIDTHYGDRLPDGRVRTELQGGLVPQAEADGVSSDAIAAALRLRERLGFRGQGVRGMYLCHTFCELGATPLADALDDLHDFLVSHPGEVVVMINQDAVTPADFVGAMDRAGLSGLAYTPPANGPWATLGDLIRSDRRLVVLAENEAGAAPWYQLAFERNTEETPYSFGRVAQLVDPPKLPASCADNRGPAGAPLLLINHWITSDPLPLPSNAATINARAPLLRRAQLCGRLRHHVPNLLAVDFYRRGDLFAVVDELNGVS